MSKAGTSAPQSVDYGALLNSSEDTTLQKCGATSVDHQCRCHVNSAFSTPVYNAYGQGQNGIDPQGYGLSESPSQHPNQHRPGTRKQRLCARERSRWTLRPRGRMIGTCAASS
jgi:hypothetical protein